MRRLAGGLVALALLAGCGSASSTTTSHPAQSPARASQAATTSTTTRAASTPAPTVEGARALTREYMADLIAGRFADACALVTLRDRAKIGSGDPAACPVRIALGARLLGPSGLRTEAARFAAAPIVLHGDTASSGIERLVWQGGRWLLDVPDTAGG